MGAKTELSLTVFKMAAANDSIRFSQFSLVYHFHKEIFIWQ